MKYFVVIVGVLALLAITQAQDETILAEPSEISSSAAQPSESRPPRPERPGRPGRRPQPNEEPNQELNVNPEGNPPKRLPHRQPVFFDFGVGNDLGHHNIIGDASTKAAPAYDYDG